MFVLLLLLLLLIILRLKHCIALPWCARDRRGLVRAATCRAEAEFLRLLIVDTPAGETQRHSHRTSRHASARTDLINKGYGGLSTRSEAVDHARHYRAKKKNKNFRATETQRGTKPNAETTSHAEAWTIDFTSQPKKGASKQTCLEKERSCSAAE